MKTMILAALLGSAVVLTASVSAADTAFNAKTGAWEMTSTTTRTGGTPPAMPKMTPEQLAQMPPGARAQMEKTMKALSGEPVTDVSKSCITQKDLEQDHLFKSADEAKCKRNVIAKTATRVTAELSCADPKGMNMKVDFQAPSPDTIVGTMDMTQEGRPEKLHVDVKGRWLGDSCAGIKHDD
jgi:hypothetical protein